MAMNKAETARMEELERLLAFRWPTEAEPEPQEIPPYGETTEGWVFNAHCYETSYAWSTSLGNGRYYNGKKLAGSQDGARLYKSELDALIAMRWAVCRKFAKELRNIDLRIAMKGSDDGL